MEQITRRNNILKAYHHQVPDFIPSISDCDMCYPSVLEECAREPGTYKDAWGVIWHYYEGQPGGIQDVKDPVVLEEVSEWRDIVQFPDVEAYDWAAGGIQGYNDVGQRKPHFKCRPGLWSLGTFLCAQRF